MRKRIIFIFSFIIALNGYTQNSTIDSLIRSLKSERLDSNIYYTSIKIAKIYSDSAYDKSLIYFNKALEVAEKSSDRKKVAHIYHQIGYMYQRKGEFPTALTHFNNALEIHEYLNNRKGIGQLLNDIGLIYKTWGKYDKALDNYIKALKFFDEIGDSGNGAMASNNIGQIFYYRGEYEKSIEYFKKYLEVNKKNKAPRAVAGAANNIASAYLELQKYDDALNFYVQAMRVYDSLGIKLGVAIIKDNIGLLFIKKKQYNDALLYHSDAIRIFENIGSQQRLCVALQNVGQVYSKLNQPDQAIKHLNRSLEIATNLKLKESQKDVYNALAEAYSQKKYFEKAFYCHKLYVQIKDSLLNSETIEKIESIQAEYEAQKKERELTEINQKVDNQKVIIVIVAGLFILFIFLISLLVRENHHKKGIIKKSMEQITYSNEIIRNLNLQIVPKQIESINFHLYFNSFWQIKSNNECYSFYIPFNVEKNIVIAFISKNNTSFASEIINLKLIDFMSTLKEIDTTISIKTQFNNFLLSKGSWLKEKELLNSVNVDFWCIKTDSNQHKYSGSLVAFQIDHQNMITNIHENQEIWHTFEKGCRFYFNTIDNVHEFEQKEKEILEFTLKKTISNTSEIPFSEQKELFSNSLELIEAGIEGRARISIYSFMS